MQSNTLYTLQQALQPFASDLTNTLPAVIFACILIILGLVIGSAVDALIRSIFGKLRVNDVLIATGAHKLVERTGLGMDTGKFVGLLCKWFIILFFFDVALEVLGLPAATQVLRDVILAYLPRILVSAGILFGAIVLAHMAERAILAGVRADELPNIDPMAKLARGVIITLGVLGVLVELRVAWETSLILFAGIVFATSLALGLAVGLGGKSVISRYIGSLTGRSE